MTIHTLKHSTVSDCCIICSTPVGETTSLKRMIRHGYHFPSQITSSFAPYKAKDLRIEHNYLFFNSSYHSFTFFRRRRNKKVRLLSTRHSRCMLSFEYLSDFCTL